MSYLKKLYETGEKKVNQLINKTDSSLSGHEKKLDALQKDFELTIKTLAELKALGKNAKKEIKKNKKKAKKIKKATKKILKEAEKGKISKKSAEKIALQSLSMRKTYKERVKILKIKLPDWQDKIMRLQETANIIGERLSILKSELEEYKIRQQADKILNRSGNKTSDNSEQYEEKLEEKIIKLEEIKEEIIIENNTDYQIENTDITEVDDFLEKEKIYDELESLKNEIKKKK